jgi:hypothetical protein
MLKDAGALGGTHGHALNIGQRAGGAQVRPAPVGAKKYLQLCAANIVGFIG